jgi:hypothetical protein
MIPQPFGFIGAGRPKVGDFYQGGIIVYVDYGSLQGLIAQNQITTTNLAWGPSGDYTQSNTFGQGYTNTQNAYNALSPASNTALYTAWNLVYNGYSDWFLPNDTELYYVWQSRGYLPFWTSNTLWSSYYNVGIGFTAMDVIDYNGTQTNYLRSETNNRLSIACRYMNFS